MGGVGGGIVCADCVDGGVGGIVTAGKLDTVGGSVGKGVGARVTTVLAVVVSRGDSTVIKGGPSKSSVGRDWDVVISTGMGTVTGGGSCVVLGSHSAAISVAA